MRLNRLVRIRVALVALMAATVVSFYLLNFPVAPLPIRETTSDQVSNYQMRIFRHGEEPKEADVAVSAIAGKTTIRTNSATILEFVASKSSGGELFRIDKTNRTRLALPSSDALRNFFVINHEPPIILFEFKGPKESSASRIIGAELQDSELIQLFKVSGNHLTGNKSQSQFAYIRSPSELEGRHDVCYLDPETGKSTWVVSIESASGATDRPINYYWLDDVSALCIVGNAKSLNGEPTPGPFQLVYLPGSKHVYDIRSQSSPSTPK